MKLIFVNRYFWPDQSATSQMLSDVAFALAEGEPGREVWVITSRQLYDRAAVPLESREAERGVRIVRVWTTRWGRRVSLGRLLDYATFLLSAAWALFSLARQSDVVVVKTDPPLLSVVAAPIVRLRGARLVNWLQDVFPEVAAALGFGGTVAGVLTPVLQGLRDRSLAAAAANVVLSAGMAQRVRRRGVAPERIVVIPNWADGAVIRPVAREENTLRAAWGLEGQFVVAYSGNLGRAHDSAAMLDAMSELEHEGARVAWVIIGGGAQFARMQRDVALRGLASVQFQDLQPRARLAESLGVGDVHIVSLRPELEGLIVPSKIYGVLAAGRSVVFIGDCAGEVARIVREAGCGACVAPGDGCALAQLLRAWAADRTQVEAMGQRARTYFESGCDRRLAVARWRQIINSVSEGRPVGGGLEETDAEKRGRDAAAPEPVGG